MDTAAGAVVEVTATGALELEVAPNEKLGGAISATAGAAGAVEVEPPNPKEKVVGGAIVEVAAPGALGAV